MKEETKIKEKLFYCRGYIEAIGRLPGMCNQSSLPLGFSVEHWELSAAGVQDSAYEEEGPRVRVPQNKDERSVKVIV